MVSETFRNTSTAKILSYTNMTYIYYSVNKMGDTCIQGFKDYYNNHLTWLYRFADDKPLEIVDKKHAISSVSTVNETLQTLTVNQTTPADSAVYKAIITNVAGETTSIAPVEIKGQFTQQITPQSKRLTSFKNFVSQNFTILVGDVALMMM